MPGAAEEVHHRSRRRRGVEALLLHRRSYEQLAALPLQHIYVGRPEHVIDEMWRPQAHHLALDRPDAERSRGRSKPVDPGARCDDRGVALDLHVHAAGIGQHPRTIGRGLYSRRPHPFDHPDSHRPGGGVQRGQQQPGVHLVVLGGQEASRGPSAQVRLEREHLVRGQRYCLESARPLDLSQVMEVGFVVPSQCDDQRALPPEPARDARRLLDGGDELGVSPVAVDGQVDQRRLLGLGLGDGRQHSGRRRGGPGSHPVPLQDDRGSAAPRQLEGDGQADDARADYDDLRAPRDRGNGFPRSRE